MLVKIKLSLKQQRIIKRNKKEKDLQITNIIIQIARESICQACCIK